MNTIATFSRPRQKLGLFLSVVMSMALLFTLLATSDIGRAQAQTTADSCVVPVSGDGTITGSWSSDCASEGRSGSYARFYTFTLGEPRDVAITLESQVNTYLYAREGEGTDGRIVYEDNDDDNSVFSLASSTDSGISESLGAGVYTIEATTVTPGEMGEFTLTIRGVTGAYDALFNRYDTDGDGQINKPEVIAAVRDYLGGQITKAQVVEVIRHYIIGPPTPTPEPTPDPTPTPSPTPPASDKVYTLRELAELEDEREFSDPDIRIRVQAYVHFVGDDIGNLTLWIRDAGYSEYCYFDEAHRTAVTALSGEEQVTVDGTFNGTWLRDCVLVTGSTSEPAPPPAPEPPASDKVYTLRELAELEDEREFSDPDIRIRVQAYVHFVGDDIGNLTLWIRDAGYSEYCYFDEAHRTAVTALSGEEQVTVDGTFNGTWLRDCVLVTGPTSTITFGDLNWSSVMLQNRIAQYIAEKGYGYSTSVESGTARPLFQALRAGNIDVLMEVWLPNQEEDWEEALAEGAVSSPGRSLGTDWQSAFVIPKYLQEQYPDLDSVEDLKEEQYRSLFATDETDGKARLVSCVIGWQCEGVNAKQIEGYGLSEHVHIVNPASGYALFADLTEAYENEEPWLGYQWGTSESALQFDLVRLEEPAYSDECWETTMACAYEDNTILIAVNAGLSESAVDFVDVLTAWDFNVEEVYKPVVRWQGENPDTNTEDAAMWWLRENNDAWSQWVTADASAAIQEALDSDEIPDGWPEAPSITPEPPADSCVGTVSGDGTVSGSWSSDCASEGRSGSYASYHTFTLTETADVTITAESGVDTYLFLREGAGRDGSVVDENDDHDTSEFSLASTTDSGISESLDAGSYTIEVTTYTAGETGEFTLTISGLPAALTPQPSMDRAALVALYNATNGDNWTDKENWLSDEPLGEWQGVTTDDDGRVTQIRLWENNLIGSIPADLGNLTSLNLLALHINQLNGSIPMELGNLSNLTVLDLFGNQLSGQIPSELGGLANLQRLYLGDNDLSGEIPAALGSLASLEELDLRDNELSGEVPEELGNLSNLSELYLYENQLSGEIPSELGNLSNLTELQLCCNELSGEIPAELGNLASLVVIALDENQLNGEIPEELGNLSNLSELYLYENQLSGEIPSELGRLANLTVLYAWNNQLSGEIPVELGRLNNLQRLNLDDNELSGGIPTELGSLSNLTVLDLFGNQLSGEIPSELGNLANLRFLTLSNNQLNGGIPTELGRLTELTGLHLWGNQLSGEIPAELGNLSSLTILNLFGNELSGEIPSELLALLDLEIMTLWGNQFHGDVLTHSSDRNALSSLYNATSGAGWTDNEYWLTNEPVFTWYGVGIDTNGHVTALLLEDNQLTGEMPSELGSLSSLIWLNLSRNQLSGEIPPELGNLSNLEWLSLAENELSGCVPSGLINVEFNDLDDLGLPLCSDGN